MYIKSYRRRSHVHGCPWLLRSAYQITVLLYLNLQLSYGTWKVFFLMAFSTGLQYQPPLDAKEYVYKVSSRCREKIATATKACQPVLHNLNSWTQYYFEAIKLRWRLNVSTSNITTMLVRLHCRKMRTGGGWNKLLFPRQHRFAKFIAVWCDRKILPKDWEEIETIWLRYTKC